MDNIIILNSTIIVNSIEFSVDSNYLFVIGDDIHIYDTDKFEKHDIVLNNVYIIYFSELYIAIITNDNTIEIYNMKFLKVHTINNTEYYEEPTYISFSQNLELMAIGTKYGKITIYNTITYEKIKIIQQQTYISSIKFTKDCSKLIIGSFDKTVNIYDINNNFNNIITLFNFTESIYSIYLAENIIVFTHKSLKIYDILTYVELFSITESWVIDMIAITNEFISYNLRDKNCSNKLKFINLITFEDTTMLVDDISCINSIDIKEDAMW